jgi:molybdopterin molybdotransferase
MLAGLARSAGAEAFAAATVPDEPEALRRAIAEGLRADVLILSGGVSAGRRDLVPAALEELGVARVFHKLRLKPGKPLWFGVGPARGDRPGTLVFGLPGNPVSGVVGFVLFVGPALRILAGHSTPPDPTLDVRLALPFRHSGDRPTFYPARLGPVPEDGGPRPATPLDWAGSADLRTVADADGFLLFPPGDREHPASEIVRFLPLG